MYFQYFKINTEEINQLVKEPLRHRRKDYHEIMWLTSGAADFIVDGDQFRIEANAFFIFPKGRMHQFLPNQHVEGHVIRFSEDLIEEFPRLLFSRFNRISEIKIHTKDQDIFNHLFQVFYKEFNDQENKTLDSFHIHLIQSIIYKLHRIKEDQFPCSENHEQNTDTELFDRFQILMDAHITEHRPVKFYADILGVTTRKLNNVVKRIMDKTTMAILNERLCIEAKTELFYSSETITQIGYKLGFEDNSYFTRFFKRQSGISPKAFRNQSLNVK